MFLLIHFCFPRVFLSFIGFLCIYHKFFPHSVPVLQLNVSQSKTSASNQLSLFIEPSYPIALCSPTPNQTNTHHPAGLQLSQELPSLSGREPLPLSTTTSSFLGSLLKCLRAVPGTSQENGFQSTSPTRTAGTPVITCCLPGAHEQEAALAEQQPGLRLLLS